MPRINTSLKTLLAHRANLKTAIRLFFEQRQVLEVDCPALAPFGVTDPNIDNIIAWVNNQPQLLQSSPEYFMKRLLAAGSGSIYSLNYAYRDGEKGAKHNPEFMMLEWYRVGWNETQLMEEVTDLFQALGFIDIQAQCFSYQEAFIKATNLDPLRCPDSDLQNLASTLSDADFSQESRNTCLDLIFSLQVEPALPDGLVYIKDYPPCQSALAQLDNNANGELIARRFEAFYDQMEMANGYFELTCAKELRQRLEYDQTIRRSEGKPERAIDENFLDAMTSGLPECAGVALGVDRLLMKLLGSQTINEVLPSGNL